MFIHLGSDEMLPIKDLIAIIKIEPVISKAIKEIIEIGFSERKIISICNLDRAKSLIIAKDRLFLSPISSNTLYRRAGQVFKEGYF